MPCHTQWGRRQGVQKRLQPPPYWITTAAPFLPPAGTSITTATRCARQAWLQERLSGGGGGGSDKALIGQMLHELLQQALSTALEEPMTQEQLEAEVRPAVRPPNQLFKSSYSQECLGCSRPSQ